MNSLSAENSKLRKEIDDLNSQKIKVIKNDIIKELTNNSGINTYASIVDLSTSRIKDLCFSIGSQINNVFLIFISIDNNKAYCSCYISKEIVSDKILNASNIISKLSGFINGKGGGQPFYATCAGDNLGGIDKLMSEAKKIQNEFQK